MLPHPPVAKILQQQQAARQIGGKDFGRAKLMPVQILRNMNKGARVLMRWRRIHQNRFAARGRLYAEIATERRVSCNRRHVRAFPAMQRQKCIQASGRRHINYLCHLYPFSKSVFGFRPLAVLCRFYGLAPHRRNQSVRPTQRA